MLEDSLVASRPSVRTRKPLTVLISTVTHAALVVALILVPLLQSPLLPQIAAFDVLRPPQVQVTRLAETPPQNASRPASPVPRPTEELIAPIEIPEYIARVNEAPPDTAGFLPSLDGTGATNDLLNRLLGTGGLGTAASPPPPPPPPPAKPPVAAAAPEPPPPTPQAPLRLGGEVVTSNLVNQVLPVYPFLAKQARVDGPVEIEALITRDGTIDPKSIRVVSGHILLQDAAVAAVRQWRYRPTLLNGQPVEVITTIRIVFRLD